MFGILQKQVSLFKNDHEKDAAIAIDEMSLVCGEQFDPSTQTSCTVNGNNITLKTALFKEHQTLQNETV